MSELDLSIEERRGAQAIVFIGELDISTVDRAESALRQVQARGPGDVLLDLSGLRFLDSTGLRFVLSGDARQRASGGQLRIVPGPERVHRVFRIARLDERLEFVEGGDAAP